MNNYLDLPVQDLHKLLKNKTSLNFGQFQNIFVLDVMEK